MSDIDTLKRLNCSENVIEHLIAVRENALKIAGNVKIPIDWKLLKKGALLHDIGRCRTHSICHGIEGGKILRELGMSEEIAKIAERHIGAGITNDEAKKLKMPSGNFCPVTPEEKIVAYADNLTMGNKMVSFDASIKRFKKELGEGHPAIKRMEELHSEIKSWMD